MQFKPRSRRYWSALSLLPLGIFGAAIGCSSSAPTVFETGSPEELRLAEDLAMKYLDEIPTRQGRSARVDFEPTLAHVDDISMAHVRVQQMQGQVPVFGGEMIVHLNTDGSLFTITDTHVRGVPDDINTTPVLAPEDAIAATLSAYDCPTCITAPPTADLWIFSRPESARKEPRLAYRVELTRIDGTERTEAPVVFVDAETGEELWRYNNLQTGSGPTYYSGTVTINSLSYGGKYYMEDLVRKMGTFTYSNGTSTATRYIDTDDVWNATAHKAGVEAHYGAAKTYDYFKNTHGRNGIDGAGGPGYLTSANGTTKLISSLVHYSTNYNNAFWNSSAMIYGDGDGVNFGPLVSLDICGHEMTHGITERSAKLVYSGESGALNESMSDVFGAMVERYAKGESANTWKVGEEAKTPAVAGDALRYMDTPHSASNKGFTADDDPDHYTERYAGSEDNGGVHINSGIANKAFYLLAKGGSHHLGGSMADIGQPNGIGPDKAAAIWYKALTSYMTSSTNFAGARTATINAATALYGAGTPEVNAVTQAWFLVGIGMGPGTPSCSGALCTVSAAPLVSGCDPCATKICAVDSYCCSTAWDAQCVQEVSSICGKTCATCSSGAFTGNGVAESKGGAGTLINFGQTSSFSIAFWAKMDAATAHVVVKGDNGTAEWSIVTNPPNLLCFRRQGIPPNHACYATTYGTWHHYAVTFSNGNSVWYEDGVKKVSGSGTIGAATTSKLKIGNYDLANPGIVGNFDSVQMWSKALTAADVQALALRTKTPNLLGSLVAEWNFDEGKGNTVADTAGSDTLTATNMTWSPTCAACPPDTQDVNGDGKVCQPYTNCKTLLAAKPGTPSGMHLIDPDGAGGKAPFGAYCEMQQNGGGWTLAFNYGTGFTKANLGTGGADCYNATDCINQAYADVPIGSDLMFDADDVPILGGSQGARSVVVGVDPSIVGKTLYYLMNNGGNWPVEKADNSNVTHTFAAGYSCSTWGDYGDGICLPTYQLMLNDITVGCGGPVFEIGNSKTQNCAGWPDNTGGMVINHWPENYRVWSR